MSPSSPRNNLALLAVFLSRSASVSLVAPTLAELSKALGTTYEGAGSLVGVLFVGYTLAVLAAGVLADRIGRRPLLLLGAALNAACTASIAGATTLGQARLIAFGLGAAGIADLTATILLAEIGGSGRGRLLSFAHGAYAVAAVAVPLAAGAALDAGLGYRGLYLAVSAGNTALFVLLAASRGLGSLRLVADPAAPPPPLRSSMTLWLAFVVGFVYIAAESGLGVWMPTFFRDRHATSDTLAAASVAAFWATMTLGRIGLSAVVDRVHRGRLMRGLALAGAGLVAVGLAADDLPVTWACLVASGLCLSALVPLHQSVVAAAFPTSAGFALGLLGVATGAGGAFAPFAIGAVADAVDGSRGQGLAWALWLVPACLVTYALVAPRLAARGATVSRR